MENVLIEKLSSYIVQNNPELLIGVATGRSFQEYLRSKVSLVMPMMEDMLAAEQPANIIEEACLEELTSELRPSRYHYLRTLLDAAFPSEYERMVETGMLTYEIVQLISITAEVFDAYAFTETNDENQLLYYAVMALVQQYLKQRIDSMLPP